MQKFVGFIGQPVTRNAQLVTRNSQPRKVMPMKERRKFERYSVALPARMVTVSSSKKQVFEFKTRNISASGAFIDTESPFSEGTRFKMDLIVASERIKTLTGARSLIECEGNVVRSTPSGIAICFDKDCQIWSVKNSRS